MISLGTALYIVSGCLILAFAFFIILMHLNISRAVETGAEALCILCLLSSFVFLCAGQYMTGIPEKKGFVVGKHVAQSTMHPVLEIEVQRRDGKTVTKSIVVLEKEFREYNIGDWFDEKKAYK